MGSSTKLLNPQRFSSRISIIKIWIYTRLSNTLHAMNCLIKKNGQQANIFTHQIISFIRLIWLVCRCWLICLTCYELSNALKSNKKICESTTASYRSLQKYEVCTKVGLAKIQNAYTLLWISAVSGNQKITHYSNIAGLPSLKVRGLNETYSPTQFLTNSSYSCHCWTAHYKLYVLPENWSR